MKLNLALVLACLMILLTTTVSAGTLISGSRVDVQSNYPGFDGLTLVGTWSTTPAVSDVLVVNGAQLPPPYQLQKSFNVNVAKPIFEQRFEVVQQRALFVPQLVEKTYWTWNVPGVGSDKYDLCRQAVQNDIASTYNNRALWKDTGINMQVGNAYCNAKFVLQESQQGWVGSASPQGLNYEQTIDVGGIATLHLIRNENKDQLVDKVDNVVRATLVNFGEWTNAKLSEKNVYAYHEKNAIGSDQWKPYSDTQGTAAYDVANSAIVSKFGTSTVTSASFSDFDMQRIREQVQTMRDEVVRIRSASQAGPTTWSTGGNIAAIRTTGNVITIPITRTSLVSNIQFVFAGNSFGLVIPTGKPKIISVSESVSFSETSEGLLAYKIQNVGSNTGTFVVKGYCEGLKVTTQEDELTLAAGETYSGKLRNIAKSSTFTKTENNICTFEVKETNTQEKVTAKYTAEVIVKTQCAQGEESVPRTDSTGNLVVNVYDTQCQVISTKTCAGDTKAFNKVDGLWTCQDKAVVNPPKDETVSSPLVVITIILSIAASIYVAVVGRPLRRMHLGQVRGNWLYAGAIIATFVAVFFLVPFLWRVIVGFFVEVFTV